MGNVLRFIILFFVVVGVTSIDRRLDRIIELQEQHLPTRMPGLQ